MAVVPLIGIYYWRRRQWPRLGWLAATLILSLGLAEITSLPRLNGYLSDGGHVFLLTATALPQFIAMVITLVRGLSTLKFSLVWASAAVLTGIFAPLYLALVGRTRTREQVVTGSLLALLFYFAGAYIQTVPWYFVWLLGLLCAVRWGDLAADAAWASTFVLLGYGVQFWNHAGLYGWDSWTLVPGFLMAIALPALVCWVAHRRGWRVCPLLDGGEAGAADRPKAIR